VTLVPPVAYQQGFITIATQPWSPTAIRHGSLKHCWKPSRRTRNQSAKPTGPKAISHAF